MPDNEFWAHTPPKREDDSFGDPQTMRAHTEGVTHRAVEFATPFGAEELARWAGWLHDIGKFSKEFQDYLRACHEFDAGKRSHRPKAGSAEHKVAGTKLARDLIPSMQRLLAACIFGHHGGLNTNADVVNAVALALEERPGEIAIAIERALADLPELQTTPPDPRTLLCLANLPQDNEANSRYLEMLTRVIFSCLVDADGLDTEQHFHGSRAKWPSLADKVEAWRIKLHGRQLYDRETQPDTIVNRTRHSVYESCLKAASQPPGVFALTVPTGGGKTRSSLAFALAHAQMYSLNRIIYAAPYTSIIDQTARVFRDILCSEGILEHHSAIDIRIQAAQAKQDSGAQSETAQEQQHRAASENWEAPLIVTTTVQLFESLFANKTSRCRKLHNMAHSVIILDEVQTLPPSLLIPLSDGLKTLVERFGVSVVLCTATQPALHSRAPYFQEAGLPQPYPIVPEAQEHFQALSRVTYPPITTDKWTWDQVAKEMLKTDESTLAIVNTKKDALALLDTLEGENIRHLSTLLCLEHRRKILEEVQAALVEERDHSGPPVYLVSTQVVEAGVDIDFPHVFRAKASLDRIVQAGGRCNREGNRPQESSRVVVFDPLDGSAPPGDYRTALETAWNLIAGKEFDFNDPEQMTAYFDLFYSRLREKGLDRYDVQIARAAWDFPDVAHKVRLIKEDTVPVLVPYHQGKVKTARLTESAFNDLIDIIRKRAAQQKGMTRELWQRIQPLTVALFRNEAETLHSTLVEPLIPDPVTGKDTDLWLWHGTYDAATGVGKKVARDPLDSMT